MSSHHPLTNVPPFNMLLVWTLPTIPNTAANKHGLIFGGDPGKAAHAFCPMLY
jgi:hypothetical protein